jgi:hypothetical protein
VTVPPANHSARPEWESSSKTTGHGSSSSQRASVRPPLPRRPLLTPPDQVAASLEGYFWPKIFWDFLTTNLDGAVKPIPILQVINTVFGLSMFALELPVKPLAGTLVHQSIEFRLMLMPLLALAAIIMYQGTNAALYYFIGEIIYFWAYSDGEVWSRNSFID